MKTIKAFLIGIFTFVLSIASLISAVTVAMDSTTLYYKANQTEPTTFTTVCILASIILFAIGLQLMLFSLGAFRLFIRYHNTYLFNKRDRQIKEQIVDEAYRQLYKDLADAPTIELKQAILNTFYEEEETNTLPKDFADFMKSILTR